MTDTRPAVTTWTIDPAHSSLDFAVKHLVFATAKGTFTDVTGQIVLDEEHIERSTVTVEVAAASVHTRDGQRDEHLRSADFFDVENHPAITFRSTTVERTTGDGLAIAGELTIRGTARPVVLEAEFNGRGRSPFGMDVLSYSATTKIDRKEFGLNWNAALETGGVMVSDDVKITIEIEANA